MRMFKQLGNLFYEIQLIFVKGEKIELVLIGIIEMKDHEIEHK